MIRSILLPLAENLRTADAKDYAFWLAKKEGSQIHALAVIDIKAFEMPVIGTPDSFMPPAMAPGLEESQFLLEEMSVAAKDRLGQFAKECETKNISCSTELRTGDPDEIIARCAIAHDIIIMDRSGYKRAGAEPQRLDSLVSHVIRNSVRPILVVGRAFSETDDSLTIMAAYDGSLHAGRSLLVAAELGSHPGVRCILATVASSEDIGKELSAPAETFLYHHGVTPHKRVVVSSKPSDVICDLAASEKVDIVIMGAYGHGPIREMLFGSNTERVLAHCGSNIILQS
jgi:nucleotide-binding universal stress UspA family protein